jgi:non-ribosomal peptide synthetase component F
MPPQVEDVSGLKVTPVSIPNKIARYDLYLSLADTAQGLKGSLLYNADLFKPDTIARMLEGLETLLRAAVERPDARLDELTRALAAKERERREISEREIEQAGLQMLKSARRRVVGRADV